MSLLGRKLYICFHIPNIVKDSTDYELKYKFPYKTECE